MQMIREGQGRQPKLLQTHGQQQLALPGRGIQKHSHSLETTVE